MVRTVASLPESARAAFKEPLGPIFQDADALLEDAGTPLITVGDVVTYHIVGAGVTPHVAIIDGITEREPVSEDVRRGIPAADREVSVENPPGTLTESLLRALDEALQGEERTLIRVTGEEDLATLPAALLAPAGASIVYGQPGEGMVRVDVTGSRREDVRELCGALETDEPFWELVGAESPA
ncbi:MAG: GTP-dependent dephospho-CoA kinase family protein [Halobacteriota archaeon]